MSRKNRRDGDDPQPLSVETPPEIALVEKVLANTSRRRLETNDERNERLNEEFGRKRERNDRRTDKRVAQAVDWDRCCIPGCEESLRRYDLSLGLIHLQDPSMKLPICRRHETIIHNQAAPFFDNKDFLEMRQRLAKQQVEDSAERARICDLSDESNGAEQGQIYFVRLNGLIKVGWSLRLRTRLKAYGASAVILCHYPGSRQEETDLHRSLRPYRAKGREWYEDCKLISDVVAKMIEIHGQPTIEPYWTEPKRPTVGAKRYK